MYNLVVNSKFPFLTHPNHFDASFNGEATTKQPLD